MKVVRTRNLLHLQLTAIGGIALLVGSASADVTPIEQKIFNSSFGDRLRGKTLRVEEVTAGMKIPLNSVIVTASLDFPPRRSDEDVLVTISFPRGDVDHSFLSSLFDQPAGFYFSERGIETVVTKNSLRMSIHKNVILHLRGDLRGVPYGTIFLGDDVKGEVVELRGRALVSRDTAIIRERLSDIWAEFLIQNFWPCEPKVNCIKNPDGSFSMTIGPEDYDFEDIPDYYPPRVKE